MPFRIWVQLPWGMFSVQPDEFIMFHRQLGRDADRVLTVSILKERPKEANSFYFERVGDMLVCDIEAYGPGDNHEFAK